jgi:predicted flap endonuclease-1-like 5' DNA nuclease
MEKRFHFLRFVSVLLRILAALLLVAGIVAIILGFTSAGGSEGVLSQSLHWVARIAGVIAFLVGLGYFIVFWGIAEALRILLTIEQSSRAEAPVAQSVGEMVSSTEIANIVTARLDEKWGDRFTVSKTAQSQTVQEESAAVVVEVPSTVTAVPLPPVVLPPLETAAPKDETVDEIIAEVPEAEIIEDIEELVAEAAESHIAIDAEAPVAEASAFDLAVAASIPASEVLDELAQEVSFAEDVEEIVEAAPDVQAEAEAAVEDAEEWAEEAIEAADEAVQEALEEVAEEPEALDDAMEDLAEVEAEELAAEIEPEEVVEAAEEPEEDLRQKAKASLDRSLEQAARQMAELESPVVTPVAPAPPAVEDDLADIVGIGPVFRVRLRQAGITTFSDLSMASIEQLAELTEQSVERIKNEDWIGQAEERLAVG